MTVELLHEMKPDARPDEAARQRFVSGLRSFVLNELAADMRSAYNRRVLPAFERERGRAPLDGGEVHKALRSDPAFKAYSATRVHAQRMAWSSVAPVATRERDKRRRAGLCRPESPLGRGRAGAVLCGGVD